MPFIPVPFCAELEFLCTYDAQKVENTLGFSFEGPADTTALEQLAALMKSWWVGAFGTNLVAAVSLNVIKIRALDTEESPSIEYSTGLPVLGTGSGDGAPSNVAACISFSTGLVGRSRRGRNYVFGMPKADLVISTLDSGWLAAVAAAYNDIPTVIADSGWTWVVISRFHGVDPDTGRPIPREEGISAAVVNALFHDNTSDSQRRRLPGRGT